MLFKLFGQKKHDPPPPPSIPNIHDENSSTLKIIHAGGVVERYYMAVPARRIMEKHPNFILARPEVFRCPWNSVVKPEEILMPGQKYFIVPARSFKKLQRGIRKPVGGNVSNSFVSESSSIDVTKEDAVSFSSKKLLRKSFKLGKAKAKIRPVSSHPSPATKGMKGVGGLKKSSISTKSKGRKKMVTWEPSLTAIDESHSSDD